MENKEMQNVVEKLACSAIQYAAGEFDPIDEFAEMIRFDANFYFWKTQIFAWFSGITGGDEDRQEAVLILTKTVIAGVAEYVFPAVAGGFSGINLTGIQLAAIKKCIKEVDHKVSVGLVEHFKTANRDFEDAMDKIEYEMFQ